MSHGTHRIGFGCSGDVIRRAVDHLNEAVRHARTGDAIAESYRSRPQTDDDDALAMANAIAMTGAEPW
jgi:hypothetical protein